MTESTRLGRARGKMLPVALGAAALLAILVLAPFANAATPSPLTSGTTMLTLNSGLAKKAKKAGIKITAVKPSTLKGTKATFAVTGGELELPTGAGSITHSGGLKIKWGKKSVVLKGFTVDTNAKTLSAKVGGKTLVVAKLANTSVARLGFGDSISAKKLKLTSAAAKALNKKLTPKPKKIKVKKKGKTIVKTVRYAPAFKANMVIGSSTSEVEPTTVNVTPSGALSFTGDPTLLQKLANVKTTLEVIPPTTAASNVFTSPLSGGTISPLGTSGAISSTGGIVLSQVLPTSATTAITTKITLGSIGVDLAAKTASVEVIGESNAESEGKKPLNLGNLGRSSIADLTSTVTPSPATRTVGVSSTGLIQPVAAEVLEGFVKVYRGYLVQAIQVESKGTIKQPEAEKITAEKTAGDDIAAGQALGSFSFTATGE